MNKFFKRLALLLAVLMIVSMMPVQLFADNSVAGEEQSNGTGEASGNSNAVAKIGDTGYETLAEAIAAANGNGTVTLLTATTELIQALLDGQYGSIDGLTIELPAGDYGKLELGRATKYAGSKTEYFVGGFDSTATNYKAFTNADEIREYKGQSTWTPNCFYRRALNNVTIKAADNATVTIEKISADAGQIYGKANAPKYDYVLDVEIPDTNKSYWMALAWNNVTFEGINFKSSVNIESSSEKTLIDGLHFEKCNFNSGYTALHAANDANKASKGMGIRFVSWTQDTKDNLKNLTVNNCCFEDCYEGVYTNPVYGVSVTNSKFSNIAHNAVAIQDTPVKNAAGTVIKSDVDHGTVTISKNTFTDVHDRIIRFNNAGEDTTITITGNTSVNSGDSAGEIIKATTMPDSVKINMTSNTWGDVNGKTAVLGNGFNKVVVALVGGAEYTTLAEAIANATPDANGTIIYEIYGKATVDSTGWIQVARAGLTGLTKVEFVGKTSDAEICITGGLAILADQNYDIDVSFESLTLSKPNPAYGGDYGHSTNYFTTWLRNTNAAENTVTYTNCTFPNGLCNNQYGKTVVDGCTFSNTTAKLYNFWNYSNVLDGETTGVANTEIKNSTFTGTRGIKIYSEKTHGGEVLVSNTTFDGLTEKAAIVASKATDITLDKVSATDCTEGLFQKDIEGSSKDEKITITANGSAISGTFNITADKTTAAAKEEFNITAGKFDAEVPSDYLADGVKQNEDGTVGDASAYVATVNGKNYETLAEAIAAATRNSTVTLLADTRENVTIDKALTLDLNGFTLNGGTEKGKPALTVVTARVTVMDSSAAQTGTIMREDTAENSGVSSHYVIDIQGNAWVMFESGIVKNNSGTAAGKGASLVRVGNDSVEKYPGLNIKGGSFTQDNFIVIKVDRGDLFLNGGTLNSTDSYAVENWHRATIKGGTVNGAVSSWTYSGGLNSTLEISGGTVNGNVESVSYDGSAGKKAKVSITGGTVNGTLIAGIYNSMTEPTKDMATIEVTGGTFTKDPTKYLVEGSTVTPNSDGTFGVAKAYLAKVGDTSYYTMDEAFKAQTASGKPIVLLRDYTTGSTFNSGTVARVVDLNGHTWTCTGTDANSAAFEINNPNASLTVKNGKIVSSQLVGLIPSANGGTIKYDNSSLTFENVQMSTTATSGIETNGNNTNDTVKLVNSTLNVPNGFGIYFPSSGELIIENSKITAKTMGVQVCAGSLSINEGSAITVTGDAVEKTENDGAIQDGAAISIVNRTGYKGLGTVTVSGGKFTAKKGNSAIKAYNWENNTESKFTAREKVAVSGGTFSSAVPEEYCAEGFIPTKNEDGTYGVKEGKYVAQIGDVKYETLADAIAAANDGDTITLLADINTPEKTYEITKNLTIDLNGKTVTGSGYDGVFEVTGKNIEVFLNATNGGKVIAAENSGSAGKYAMAVWMCGAGSKLTINGGEFIQNITSTDDKQMDMIYASAGTIIINSGSFTSGTPKWTLNIKDSAYKDGTANIIVNGGTFTDYDPRNAENEGKGTSLVADGVGIDKNADGTFTAKSGMAAQIVDADGNSVAAYTGLYDAIKAAKDGETVILLSDRKNFVTNTVNANITIDLNGKTLSLGNNNPFFCTNGEVTIQNGTIDTKSTYACVIVNAYNKLTLKNVKITGVTGDNGKNLVNVCSNAEVTIDKDTVLTASGSNGAAVFIGQDADAKYTLNVYGKVIQESKSFAISGNGSYKGTTTINIYDGAEVKSASVAIYHPQAGVINVNGGLVEGYCAIGIKSGTLNINGGTVRGTADDHVLDDSNSTSGTIIYDGSAIIVDSRSTGYAGNVNINVTGGTVESYYSTAIREIGEQDKPNMTQLTKLNVIGGSVLGASKNPVNVTSDMLVRDISVINISVSGGTFKHAIPDSYCADGFIPTQNEDGTYGVQKAMKGSEKNPYTLKELGEMTRAQYIAAQEALGGTMYVEIGDYSYDKDGVLGNGVRNDTPGQTPDHSKLNAYGENGYLGEKNDGANGKNIIFVGGSITSRVTGYTSIDNIGTSLLLAVPAYTNVTFEGVTFKNVMSFNYQLYTSPWSQLGELKFSGCTFNGIIVGAIAAQTLTFDGCEFTNYTNTTKANNSNPTWIRPAYGNWTKGDNEGQGSDFRSLTTINFTGNTVTSTRPVKFERIAQWEMVTKVTVTGNEFDIKSDGSSKNVGLYFGANAKFDLVIDNNKKTDGTAALYTAVYSAPNEKSYAGLPAGSTVKDAAGNDVEVAGVIWETTDALTLKTTTEAVELVNSKGISVKFATLEEAFAAAANGDTITLLEDCKSDRINLEDKSVTVALNGKTLTSTAAYGVMFCAKNGNKITIDGTVAGSKLVGTLMITAGTDGHIEVNGGTYESSLYCPIYVNGAVSSENSTVTVKNAIIKATNSNSNQDSGCAVYLAGYSTSVFENCTITAPITGIEIRAGKLTLNNCDVTGGNGEVTAVKNGNGTTVTNAALAISQHTTKKPIDVTIDGGTFNGKAAVYQTDVQGTGSADVKIAVKSGTFNGKIVGETDGAIVISGGKFKVKVDDKYFADKLACSATPNADGYYTVKDHPITGLGLSIGESLTLRITVDESYKNGKLKYTYIGAKDGKVHSGIVYRAEKDKKGNWVFRISDINAQRADVIYTVQYVDESEKEVGSAKEVSILKYCEGLVEQYKNADEAVKNSVNTLVCKLLNYSAAAMDYRQGTDKDDRYNNMTWGERATALRKRAVELCGTVTDYAFEVSHEIRDYGYDDNAVGANGEKKVGIEFSDKIRLFFNINYNENYTYTYNGLKCIPEEVSSASTTHRIYVTVAPFAYDSEHCIEISDADGFVYEIAYSLDNVLETIFEKNSGTATGNLAKATYEYCRALTDFAKYFK